jgi:Phosphoglycerate dehydrogenase and related dehydrogenases
MFFLDVFKNDPLTKNHKFWDLPNITITPHIAAVTDIESSVNYIFKRINSIKKVKKIKSEVNLKKGY